MKHLITVKILLLAAFLATAIQGKAQWAYMKPMPTARAFAASCVLDNKIYVIGGISSDTSPATSIVEVYDPVTNTWNTNVPNLPVGLSAATAVELGGKIYVIGGEDSYLGNRSAAVFEFDPGAEGVWTKKNDLPTTRSWHAAAVYDNTIYVIAGISADNIMSDNVVLRYDKINDKWDYETGIPSSRGFIKAETANGKMYAMGGMYFGDPYATVFMYDKVSWTTKAPMPEPKFWFGSAVIDDQIYVFGGYGSALPPAYSNGTWRYDPVADDWTNIGVDLPVPIGGMTSAAAEDATGKKCLYAFGGGSSLSETTDITLKFSPKKSDWTYQEALPTARAFATSCVVGDKIYVIGGTFSKSSASTDVVEAYNWVTDSWDTTVAHLPVPLSGASSRAINGKVYVTGGRTSFQGVPLDVVFVYDPLSNTWETKTSLSPPRSWHGTAVLDGKLYTMGGYGNWGTVSLDSVARYDPGTNTWAPLPHMLSPRAFLTSEAVDGKIYSMGGLHLEIPRAAVEEFDPQTGQWTAKGNMPQPKFWHGSVAGINDDDIYVFGGAASYIMPSPGIWRYDPSVDEWSDLHADMPVALSAFASSIVKVSDKDQCIYAFGGALPAFWADGASPLVSGAVYKYCLSSSVGTKTALAPPVILSKNYPNPFNDLTTIQYELRNAGEVSIKIYNLTGQEVSTAFTGFQPAGEQQIMWRADGLPAGVYVYMLRSGEFVGTGKLVIQK